MSQSKDERFDALYRRIPVVKCAGLCQAYCGPIPMTRHERLRIIKATGIAPKSDPLALACNMLTPEGRCQVHPLRPLICRLFGAVEDLRCPHGCEPEGGYLTRAEMAELVREAHEISPIARMEDLVPIGGS